MTLKNPNITWPVDRGQYRSNIEPKTKTWTTITIGNHKRYTLSLHSSAMIAYSLSYIEFLNDRYQEIYLWCSQQYQQNTWKCFADKKAGTLRFHFKNTDDAVLFQLKWPSVAEDS